MQIILNQEQIETAIRNHLLSFMSLNEGQDMEIDLRATRGEGGYTAEINIVGAGQARQAETAPRTSIRNTVNEARQKVSALEPAAESTEEADVEETETAEAAKETPKPRKGSIFAKHTKPNNKADADAETEDA